MSVGFGHVWWLFGPPSVGKSATAWQLFAEVLRGEPRGYVDVDQVGMCYPEPADDPGRYALKARALGLVVRRFIGSGARKVVISGVADETSMATFVEKVHPARVTFCRLQVDPVELERRLRSRYSPDDVARALAEADAWDRRDPDALSFDTGMGTPLDVALRVVEAIRSEAPPLDRSPSDFRRAAAELPAVGEGRAFLVCGPTGVGKSSVGFGVFNSLLADGRTAAYLDLQQLGFLEDLPDDAPGSVEVSAGCVADLWKQYRSAGASDLILSGRLGSASDVQGYRDVLGATSLIVCQLRADSESLRDRILSRTRGGGPMLAGDTREGLSVAGANTVLREALIEQERLATADVADLTLDTDDESVEAVVRRARTAFDSLSTS